MSKTLPRTSYVDLSDVMEEPYWICCLQDYPGTQESGWWPITGSGGTKLGARRNALHAAAERDKEEDFR